MLVPFAMFRDEFSKIPRCDIRCLESDEGHDAFLLSTDVIGRWISEWVESLMDDDQRYIRKGVVVESIFLSNTAGLCRED